MQSRLTKAQIQVLADLARVGAASAFEMGANLRSVLALESCGLVERAGPTVLYTRYIRFAATPAGRAALAKEGK